MVASILFLLIFIPVVLFIGLGLPVLIGILVYRDAKKREDISPALWGLVAALAPCYIGLIVYLVIRRDYPLKPWESVQRPAPQQGFTTDQSEEGFSYAQSFDENRPQQPAEKKAMATWVKVLIIAVVIVALFCVLALVGTVIYSVVSVETGIGSSSYPSYYGY